MHSHHLIPVTYSEERRHIFSAVTLWWFGAGLVQVFIPIYLFQVGYGLADVFLFFFIQQAARAFNVFFSLKAVGRIGAKHVLSWSFVFPALFYVIFSAVAGRSDIFFAAAVLSGLAQAYGWTAYHMHVSKIVPDESRGRSLAAIMVLQMVALAVAPVIGGFMIERSGIFGPLILAVALFVVAAVILLRTDEVSKKRRIDTGLLRFRSVVRDSMANGFFNSYVMLSSIVWPLFMYLIIGGYADVGIIDGAGWLVSAFAIYYLGRVFDGHHRKKLLIWATLLLVPVSAFRFMADSIVAVAVVNILYHVVYKSDSFVWVSIFHSNLGRYPRLEYLLWFETMGAVVTAAVFLPFIFAAGIMSVGSVLTAGIIVSALLPIPTLMVRCAGG